MNETSFSIFFDVQLRKNNYKNRNEFCEAAKLSKSYISELLSGSKKGLTLTTILLIQDHLKLSEKDFIIFLKHIEPRLAFPE